MVGNDIIDLELTRQQSNWKRKGFLQKIFTSEEQNLIHSSADPSGVVWRMWSMKESAYKLFLQTGQNRFFYPLRLRCEINSLEEGVVFIGDLQTNTYSVINSKYIFTSANLVNDKDIIANNVFYLPRTDYRFQSQFTRQKLLNGIAQELDLNEKGLDIRKTDHNVPEVFCDGKILDVSVTLTHHGHYGGYSWARNN